jgi:hypothetical protein
MFQQFELIPSSSCYKVYLHLFRDAKDKLKSAIKLWLTSHLKGGNQSNYLKLTCTACGQCAL